MRKILRTVTVKYMVIFMSLIIVTVFVLGAMIATILGNYAIDVKMEELSISNVLFEEYHCELSPESSLKEMIAENRQELEKILSITFMAAEGCQLLVADKDGKIILHAHDSEEENHAYISFFDDETKNVSILNNDYLSRDTMNNILESGNLSMNNTCDGLFSEAVIWYASVSENSAGECDGYIISFVEAGDEDKLFTEMLYSVSLTAIWLLFVALVAIYVVSYKVMTPLREISYAAKCFARGKYDVRVPERGNDEVTDLAKSFNKMAVEIQSKDEMQKQFLSSASHDLRTPMTTIAGFVDGIVDGAIPPEKHEHYMNIIKNEVQRLSRLVTSLLDISRLQSGARKFTKKPFNICEMARQTIISFENQFNEKKLDVEFDVDEFDMIAIGDTDAINQVVYNLCHNAIKFSNVGAKYTVRIKYDEDKVKFSVYNEGIGIAQDELPFVFDRFFKSDKSRGLDKTGVGLGLFISKTIIDSHNGDMSVESEYEKWCEFSFTLERGD